MTFAPTSDDAARVHVVTIYDGADFDRVLDCRIFTTWAEADTQGRLRVAQLRGQRRAAGERDSAFVDAIRHDVVSRAIGEPWAQPKPQAPETARGYHAAQLTMAGAQRRRLTAGGVTERFARMQLGENRAQFLAHIRRPLSEAACIRNGGSPYMRLALRIGLAPLDGGAR